jgi:hypothetical protein
MARNAATRLLRLDPGIVRENLYTVCVCGELQIVERILSKNRRPSRKSTLRRVRIVPTMAPTKMFSGI